MTLVPHPQHCGCHECVAGKLTATDHFVAGMKRAAEIVSCHWNSADSLTNQKAQALRSAAAILRAAEEFKKSGGVV